MGPCLSVSELGGPSLTLLCTTPFPITHEHAHTHTCFSLSYLSFSRYPLFVLLVRPISGLCYVIHAEDDSHIVIWGMKAVAVEESPPPSPLYQHTHRHTCIIQHLRLHAFFPPSPSPSPSSCHLLPPNVSAAC